jgi:hypothetical protein
MGSEKHLRHFLINASSQPLNYSYVGVYGLKKKLFQFIFFSRMLNFLDLHLICCVKWDTTCIQYAKVSKHLSSHKSSKNVKHLLPLWDSM